MGRGTLRTFLAASAAATLGILGAGSAVGQQTFKEVPLEQLLKEFGVKSPDGVSVCYDPNDLNKRCWGITPMPSGCVCDRGLKGIVKVFPEGKLSIELKGLTSEQMQAITKQLDKADSPPTAK
jgi:hypothetical protein